MLIVVSGLPGTGKTTIARKLAIELVAVYLRIDSIEQSIRGAGRQVEGVGYSVAHAVAWRRARRIITGHRLPTWQEVIRGPALNPSSPVSTLKAQLRKRLPFALNLRTSYSESEREGRLQSAERAVPTQFANDTTNLLSA
jgi:AAA domain-containing protein